MITHGANLDQLTNLGSTLNRQIDSITQVMSTVDGVLNATAWSGPARDQFVEDWNGSFKQALGKLNEAFGLAGRDCNTMSDELRQLLGVRG